jgi:hypothetical protein
MEHQQETQVRTPEARKTSGFDSTNPVLDRVSLHPILQLQQNIGNRALQRLLTSQGTTPQCKLMVGAPDDQYEHEADRVAQEVMSMPAPPLVVTAQASVQGHTPKENEMAQRKPLAPTIAPLVRRTPEEKDKIRTEALSRAPTSVQGSFEPGSNFEARLSSSGGGSPLPANTRAFMESRFGVDFSEVRLRTGGEAAQLNRAIGAQAFTHGQDIYLGEGKDDFESSGGKRLLAHELTHTIQQDPVGAFGPALQRARWAQVGGGLVQRDPDDSGPSTDPNAGQTLASGPNSPDLNEEYATAVKMGDWRAAAEWLNGFSKDDILTRLAQLTTEQIANIHEGAVENPRVGRDSQVAQLTESESPPVSSAPAGAGGRRGRSAKDEDQEGDSRTEEQRKQQRQQERRQQRQQKSTKGRDMDRCGDFDRPTFDSKDAVLDAIRKHRWPDAVEGNARAAEGNDASHPEGHFGVYESDSKKNDQGYVGTIFSQLCEEDNGEVKTVWTTNINIGRPTAGSTSGRDVRPQIIQIHPAFRNIYKFESSALVPSGRTFIVATPTGLVDAFLGAIKTAGDIARLQVRTPAPLGQRALTSITAATTMVSGLVIGIAFGTGGAAAAPEAAVASEAAAALGIAEASVPMVMTFLAQVAANDNAEVFAAAAAVAIYMALRGVLPEETADERAKAFLDQALANKQVLATEDVTARPSLANAGAQLAAGRGSYTVIAVLRS